MAAIIEGEPVAVTEYSESKPAVAESHRRPLALVTVLFFAWGFLTCLNLLVVSHLKSVFDLSRAQVLLVRCAIFSPYLLLSIPAARLVDWIGYQRTMVSGLLATAAGAFMLVPAASVFSYPLFVTALLVMAAGMTILQVSANSYVAILGGSETASSRLSLAHGFNSLGIAIAPKIGAAVMLSAAPVTLAEIHNMSPEALHYYSVAQAASTKIPYLLAGVLLVVLAAAIGSFRLPDIIPLDQRSESRIPDSLWSHRNLILGSIGIFVYVGVAVSIGRILGDSLLPRQIGNASLGAATGLVSLYWLGVMAGQFIGAGLLRRIRTGSLLAICACGAATMVCAAMLTTGHIAMWSILAVALFHSIMFPSVFTLGIAELGPLTSHGSGVMITAIVGGAIIPAAQRMMADHIGSQYALLLPVFCYLYILFFALRGSMPNSARWAHVRTLVQR